MSELGFLLDTHILIWWTENDSRLDRRQLVAIESNAPIFVSAVSVFEIAVKRSIGKLRTDGDPLAKASSGGAIELPVTWKHARAVEALPLLHRDPFDHLLIAQALSEGLTLVTADTEIRRYDVPLL